MFYSMFECKKWLKIGKTPQKAGFNHLARQEQPRLNQTENALKYVFLNGVASVVAQRQYKPRSYANNYNVHGANGKFVRI